MLRVINSCHSYSPEQHWPYPTWTEGVQDIRKISRKSSGRTTEVRTVESKSGRNNLM